MRRNLWDCGCKPCCKRLSFSNAISETTTVFEPFDYWSERHHEFAVSISCSPGSSGGEATFWFQPVTVDVLLWCDESAQNEAGRLRVRVEHGQKINVYDGSASVGPLATHTVAARSDYNPIFPYLPAIRDVVELLIYLEYVKADGSVSQSAQVVRIPDDGVWGVTYGGSVATISSLSVKWDVWYENDTINAAAFVTNLANLDPSNSLAFPHHVFTEPVPDGIKNNRHGFYSEPRANVTRSVFHYSKRASIKKSPCIPADTSPYCAGGELESKPSAWPWRHAGECTAWERPGGIIGLPCVSDKTGMRLEIPRAEDDTAGPNGMGVLISGSYELTSTSEGGKEIIGSSQFWFSDTPGTQWTKTFPYGGSATYTLQSIEISALLSVNGPLVSVTERAEPQAPCGTSSADWPAIVYFFLSCVIANKRHSYRWSARAGVDFLKGQEIEMRPYVWYNQRANLCNAFIPTTGYRPFLHPDWADVGLLGSGYEGIGYAGCGDFNPPPFKAKLV